MLRRLERIVFGLMELALVLLLAGMFFMVFGNVVLRYAFNSGIVISEELSRIFFVWLTFIGAVVTFRDREHIGVDSLVMALPKVGRLTLRVIGDLIILLCCGVMFWGAWLQAPINASITAPVTGMPLIWQHGVAFVASAGIGLITLVRLGRILTGRMTPEDRAELFAGLPGEAPRHAPQPSAYE
jgi:TRAP-type C4-dicarboxylate transport system permease small subunit